MRPTSTIARFEELARRLDTLEHRIAALERLPEELTRIARTAGELKFELEQMQEA